MVCNNPKELLAEIKKYMDIHEIQTKDLAVMTRKSQQAISQIFTKGNPQLKTLFEICDAIGLQIDITKGDTE